MKISGMTPGEYKNGGKHLTIHYSYAKSLFGEVLLASTPKGIVYIGFADNRSRAFKELRAQFPNATYIKKSDRMQKEALRAFKHVKGLKSIKIHLKGTPFQMKVWKTLLTIPSGKTSTYGAIAKRLKNPRASRAAGTAIGRNPVAYLIPCHRVIRATGAFGGYHWGTARKAKMLTREARPA